MKKIDIIVAIGIIVGFFALAPVLAEEPTVTPSVAVATSASNSDKAVAIETEPVNPGDGGDGDGDLKGGVGDDEPVKNYSAEENKLHTLFEEIGELVVGITESTSPDVQKTKGNDFAGTLGLIYSILYGAVGTVGHETAYTDRVPESFREVGIVNGVTRTAIYAFLDAPSADIPAHYAGMLLPKEFVEEKAPFLYAYDFKNGPSTENSLTLLSKTGLQQLWQMSFYVAMIALVVVLIAAGFMIMFRQKVSGQTVVTITMALQNVLIGAILALASYAIGGVFLNLSKYLVLVIANLFIANGFVNPAVNAMLGSDKVVFINGPFSLFGKFPQFSIYDVVDVIDNGVTAIINLDLGAIGKALAGGIALMFFSRIIMGCLLIVTGFRIFFAVLTTYVKMIIDIALAPLVFVSGALPGRQSAFGAWFKRMFKNSLVLPVMFMFVNIAAFYFGNPHLKTMCEGQGFTESKIIECLSGGSMVTEETADEFLQWVGPTRLIGMVILMMTPSAPALLDEMFGIKASQAVGQAVREAKQSGSKIPLFGDLLK